MRRIKAVILAGGKGTRLKPYTTVFPKPLMPVSDKPILEIIINQLKAYDIKDIIITTGYLGELIVTFFGEGNKYGVNIKYSKEDMPLGTAGCLGLLKEELTETFLMINGDTLTTLNFAEFIEYHKKNGSIATIALKKRKTYIDFGIVEVNNDNTLKNYIEKPTIDHLVSMGVYCFEPSVLKYIKPGEKLDFPDLMQTLISNNERVKGYIFEGYWLDIGRPDDYERATEDFKKMKDKFLPYRKEGS